ncbi:uncharacterized protein [Elaeis guineensis]|uniref:Uncharacterized protein LOC105050951 n=1 Tax=Elaeis guineensis var. tenera TaxID=51953 RepID=A0A6I9RWP9_ELAGV|nr:uncharacterized protein LOC105050951 [Elaeis guineensis]
MGCFFSRSSSQQFDGVRVIHINGYVEDFATPVTAGQVTGKPPKHVLCTPAHLLSLGSQPLLRPDDPLEPGRLYFLLPHSVFRSDSGPVELASLMNRLTASARRGGQAPAGRPQPVRKLGPGNNGPWRPRTPTWKPKLDAIEERPVGRSKGRDSYRSPDRKKRPET